MLGLQHGLRELVFPVSVSLDQVREVYAFRRGNFFQVSIDHAYSHLTNAFVSARGRLSVVALIVFLEDIVAFSLQLETGKEEIWVSYNRRS